MSIGHNIICCSEVDVGQKLTIIIKNIHVYISVKEKKEMAKELYDTGNGFVLTTCGEQQ